MSTPYPRLWGIKWVNVPVVLLACLYVLLNDLHNLRLIQKAVVKQSRIKRKRNLCYYATGSNGNFSKALRLNIKDYFLWHFLQISGHLHTVSVVKNSLRNVYAHKVIEKISGSAFYEKLVT